MTRKRVMIVVGTRPEAIKMAPVYLSLKARDDFSVHLLVTAQHRLMLDQVLTVFGITPDVDLDLMRPDQTLSEISTRVLTGVEDVLAAQRPDAVLVHGDTTTCFFAALAAFYERIPVGHVEAGLRTYNFEAPWPEEMNRRLADPLCRWCFAPTDRSAENLRAERISESRIHVTGNTIVDALLLARKMVRDNPPDIPDLPPQALNGRRMILVTGHRRESFGKPLQELCLALRDVVRANPDTTLVYPVHLNPNVQQTIHPILDAEERIFLIPPVSYLAFVRLMDCCHLIVTDSGGIQEEAPTMGKPVLVTRETTERPEAVDCGLARVVGTDRESLFAQVNRLLKDPAAYAAMSTGASPYGDGRAAERIADILQQSLSE